MPILKTWLRCNITYSAISLLKTFTSYSESVLIRLTIISLVRLQKVLANSGVSIILRDLNGRNIWLTRLKGAFVAFSSLIPISRRLIVASKPPISAKYCTQLRTWPYYRSLRSFIPLRATNSVYFVSSVYLLLMKSTLVKSLTTTPTLLVKIALPDFLTSFEI